MNLVSFSVRKYRSITQTSRLTLQPAATILIGPNNEGKSNLVGGLAVAMTAIRSYGMMPTPLPSGRLLWRRSAGPRYQWRHDYPIGLQQTEPNGESQFDLEFSLSPSEVAEFKKEVKSDLNGTLPIRVLLGERTFKFSVPKKGPGAATLTKKADLIAKFLGRRIDFRHIRAIRTAREAGGVVQSLVQSELAVLESDPTYQAAVQQIAKLQGPILAALSKSVGDTLRDFLPSVKSVNISVQREGTYDALTASSEIVVDDGVPTALADKGDGVQSLAALSLMRYASKAAAGSRQLILAIEEPESHLHPRAIHQLKKVISDIATQHQTILTTHCPLFVERGRVDANILVVGSKARQAKNTAEIRDLLGVRVADNLSHAEVVLVVEGETDRTILSAWLTVHSTKLAQAIVDNFLVIDQLVGAGKLSYRLIAIRDAMCASYTFLDGDAAGREAVKAAAKDGVLAASDYTLAARVGLLESELEDLIDPVLYEGHVQAVYGVTLSVPAFTTGKKKWSERVRKVFLDAGKLCDDATISDIKREIAELVVKSPKSAVPPHARPILEALVVALEARIP